jgi:hypothetical protein
MISYGSQLGTLKRQTILYLIEKIKEGAYRSTPGDLWVSKDERPTGYLKDDRLGNVKLEDLSLERLTCIADKIHFRPLENLGTVKIQKQTSKEDTMRVEANVDSRYQITREEAKSTSSGPGRPTRINYTELPLRRMKEGDCIILFEDCTEQNMTSRKSTAKKGLARAAKIMRLSVHDFVVSESKDGKKVGIWRVA